MQGLEEEINIDKRLANLTNHEVSPSENTQDKDDDIDNKGFGHKIDSNSEDLKHIENPPYETPSTEQFYVKIISYYRWINFM